MSKTSNEKATKPPKDVRFTIDRQKFKMPAQELTGAVLRTLAEPNVGADRDLFLETEGATEDQPIGDADSVMLKDGMHFFTAPASIQPGRAV